MGCSSKNGGQVLHAVASRTLTRVSGGEEAGDGGRAGGEDALLDARSGGGDDGAGNEGGGNGSSGGESEDLHCDRGECVGWLIGGVGEVVVWQVSACEGEVVCVW